MKKLNQFQKPEILFNKVISENLEIPNGEFFNQSSKEFQKLREAWVSSLFAIGLSKIYPCNIRIITEQKFPDFEIQIENKIYQFEITETLKPLRKRGLEYKKREENPLQMFPYRPALGSQKGPEWIAEKIKEKKEKKYKPIPHLLIYADFETNGFNLQIIRKKCSLYQCDFCSIWILHKIRIVQLFSSIDFGDSFYNWMLISEDWRQLYDV